MPKNISRTMASRSVSLVEESEVARERGRSLLQPLPRDDSSSTEVLLAPSRDSKSVSRKPESCSRSLVVVRWCSMTLRMQPVPILPRGVFESSHARYAATRTLPLRL